eukprot:6199929-Pleurochrysis_carterae.AAC.1
MEMLSDRGYVLIDEAVDADDATSRSIEGLPILAGVMDKEDDGKRSITVLWCLVDRIGVKYVREMLTRYSHDNVMCTIIFVSLEGVTSYARKECEHNLYIEFFTYKELVFNVTKHCLVPRHRQLSEEEKERLVQKYSLSDYRAQLPRLYTSDAICRYFAFMVGSVIEIERPSGRRHATHYYRVVHDRTKLADEGEDDI